jgi:hypothetical protein
MPRDRTSKYAVTLTAPGYAFTPSLWLVRRDGRPTDANLARYVASFEASTGPGGPNAHLGAQQMTSATVRVISAVIRLNQAGGSVVARYQAKPAGGPLFTVVGGQP